MYVSWALFVYTLNYLYKSRSWPGFTHSSRRRSVFEPWHKLQTCSPYQRKTPATWLCSSFPTLKLHIPSLNPELEPKLCSQSKPKAPLFSLPLCHVHTPADAIGTTHIVAIVALQAFVVVTWPAFVAVLVELSGTHLAAAAAVWDRADPRGTGWGPRRTLTYHRTTSTHLQEVQRVWYQ